MATASDIGARHRPAHTLGELLDDAARSRPHAVAVRHDADVLTYAALRAKVHATARRFGALGLQERGATGLLLENTPESVVAFLAAARLGLRVVPLEPGTTHTQLAALRAALGSLAVVGDVPRLTALRDSEEHGPLDCVFVPMNATAKTVETAESGRPQRSAGSSDVTEALGRDADADAPFLYQYTSGSTGEPKAAVHPQRNLVNGGEIYTRAYGITEDDRILAAVPLLHSFGMVAGLVTALRAGAQLVLLGRFTPARLLRTLEQHACTVLVAAPMAYDLATRAAGAAPSHAPHALRLCLSSGAALPATVAERARERLGLDIQQVYGCTETGVIAGRRPEDGAGPDRGVGRPLPGVEVRVVDERGQAMPAGAEGALLVRTPAMFTEYLGHPEATRRALADGWYRTGDLARLAPGGHLHLIGRKESFINVGGKKVNPVEVEQVLLAHPSVAEAVVWGEAAGDTDERVRATVVARSPLPAKELTSHCRARLLPHQVPAAVDFVTALPKSALGKVSRAKVAAASAAPPPNHS
ncbi:class I adenylate-forming enzyme family protein [Streptomyces sp. NPDC047123]|uniref:class I adenylate-forming enzyme family protein n=1 Tax=Streptomyces sp. NPDC047123 TaxID=3155622 RepID=UPI0033DF649D